MKEKEIEDNLEKNLNKIEKGLILVERQKRVDIGIIDLFCKDKNNKYVIVEIKRKADVKVIVQLAKYNMFLVNNGLSKNRLRTILVTQELTKPVKEACEFFNFETRNIYKKSYLDKEKEIKLKVPNQDELIRFIKRKVFVNLSMIARHYGIKNGTASDLVDYLSKNNLVTVKKLGGSKIVRLK